MCLVRERGERVEEEMCPRGNSMWKAREGHTQHDKEFENTRVAGAWRLQVRLESSNDQAPRSPGAFMDLGLPPKANVES